MSETDLLPCPFCGSAPKQGSMIMAYIRCENCRIEMTAYQPDMAFIVDKWNTRDTAERDRLKAELEATQTALRNLVDIVERVQASQSRFGYVNGRDSGELETKLDESKALLPEAKQ